MRGEVLREEAVSAEIGRLDFDRVRAQHPPGRAPTLLEVLQPEIVAAVPPRGLGTRL